MASTTPGNEPAWPAGKRIGEGPCIDHVLHDRLGRQLPLALATQRGLSTRVTGAPALVGAGYARRVRRRCRHLQCQLLNEHYFDGTDYRFPGSGRADTVRGRHACASAQHAGSDHAA